MPLSHVNNLPFVFEAPASYMKILSVCREACTFQLTSVVLVARILDNQTRSEWQLQIHHMLSWDWFKILAFVTGTAIESLIIYALTLSLGGNVVTPKRVLLQRVNTQMKCSIMLHFIRVTLFLKVKKFIRQNNTIFRLQYNENYNMTPLDMYIVDYPKIIV